MRVMFTLCVLLAGCAQISGLDSLDIVDATADDAAQTIDASDASQDVIADVTKDASTKDVALPPSDSGIDVGPAPCVRPADCQNGAVCCETIEGTGNSPPCGIKTDNVACTASLLCGTSVSFSCGKSVVRRCTATTDCTEASYPKCCTIPIAEGGTREVCLSTTLAQIAGGTCL